MRSKGVSLLGRVRALRREGPAFGLMLVLALVGCSSSEQPTSEAMARESAEPTAKRSEPSTAAQAEEKNSVKGVDGKPAARALAIEGQNMRLVRVGEDELALQFEFFNGTKTELSPSDLEIDLVARHVVLADLPRGTAYGIVDEGNIRGRLSESTDESVAPGGSATVTAVFAAPPKETTKMLVMVAGLLPVEVLVQPAGADVLKDDAVLHGAPATDRHVVPLACRVVGGEGGSEPALLEFRLSGDVLFEFGSAKLTPAADGAISEIAQQISGPGTLTVEGHTDSVGSDASNQTLSEQRAAAVREALQAKLTDEHRYETVGFGESRPIAENTNPDGSDNPDGRAQNRRVEIRLGTVTPGTPPTLARRELKSDLTAAGFQVQVERVQRLAGYVLASVSVRNPTANSLTIEPGNGLEANATGGLTLADQINQRRYQVCLASGVNLYTPVMWSFLEQYEPSTANSVPAGADVVFWGLYAAPAADVTSMDVEIDGFGKVVPAVTVLK